jgi:hypothetical protein
MVQNSLTTDTARQPPDLCKKVGDCRIAKTMAFAGMAFALYGGHFCHREGHSASSEAEQNAPVDHGRRPAIKQRKLERDGDGFPRGE